MFYSTKKKKRTEQSNRLVDKLTNDTIRHLLQRLELLVLKVKGNSLKKRVLEVLKWFRWILTMDHRKR